MVKNLSKINSTGSSRSGIGPIRENYRISLKVNLKKLQTLRTAGFASHKRGTDLLT